MTFTPQVNGIYSFIFTVAGKKFSEAMTQDDGPKQVAEKSFMVRKWRTAMLESGSFCN